MTDHDSGYPGPPSSKPTCASSMATIRRAAMRLEYTCFAWIEGHHGGGSGNAAVEGIARIVDLSSRGVGLVLVSPIALGERVVVELLILSQLRLRATGEVVHCSDVDGGLHHRVGVRFEGHAILID